MTYTACVKILKKHDKLATRHKERTNSEAGVAQGGGGSGLEDPLNGRANLDQCHEDAACCRLLSDELMGWVTSLSFTRQLNAAFELPS